MKRFTGTFFALCVVLLLAVAGAVWLYHRPGTQNPDAIAKSSHWCLQEEDCIQEVVFRYQIQNPEGHKSSDLFFLSVKEHSDPNYEVVKRLASDSYRVKPISQSVDKHAVIKDKETGEPGVILTVDKITWVDKTRVEVALSAYSGFGDAKG
ncbi:MAG: hypothetical protein ACREA9_03955, partial [Pyrinomonadaceae bacterium]